MAKHVVMTYTQDVLKYNWHKSGHSDVANKQYAADNRQMAYAESSVFANCLLPITQKVLDFLLSDVIFIS